MSAGRNDPCPCGSGKKHKKCCGAIIPIAREMAPNLATPNQARACGSCTACCEGWLAGNIHGHEMKPGVPCHFMRPGGCSIYESRPASPCKTFICSWARAGSVLPDEFSPQRLGVIVIDVRWRDRPAFLLKAAGTDPDETLLSWMAAYSRHTGTPFYYEQRGEKLAYGPPEFQADVMARAQRGEALW
jgi:hypothetical protein